MTVGGGDIGIYGPTVTVAAFAELKARQGPIATIELFSDLGTNSAAHDQLVNAKAAGCDLSGYLLVNWERADWAGQTQVKMAQTIAGDLWPELLFLAIDIEPYKGSEASDLAYRIPRVIECLDATRAANMTPIIYTNKGAWETLMGGSPQDWGSVVGQTEIWVATMDGKPDLGTAVNAKPWKVSTKDSRARAMSG